MSRLTWAKAKPLLTGQFADWPDQWPQRFAPCQLARLQAPPVGKDWSLTCAFDEAIAGACAAGELAHEAAAFVFPPLVAWASFDDGPGEAAARWRAQRTTKTLPAVAAGDFVAWLRAQREAPSVHIAAWLQATDPAAGLAPTALDAEPAAPAGPTIDRGACVKRTALIDRNCRRWPSIERDLKDASENGLSRAAKADTYGDWWEGDALAWAEARNKLQAQPAPLGLAGTVHRMAR